MPFTPYHLGPGLALGLPLRRWLHLPTFLLASIAVDIEPLLVFVFGLDYPLHGYLHTFLAAFLYGLLLGHIMLLLEKSFAPLYKLLLLEAGEQTSARAFYAAGVIGTELHVLLDAPLYSDIKPFFPLTINPLYNPTLTPLIYDLCVAAWLLGILFYGIIVVATILRKLRKD
ncbi:MAG: hydrolase [Infirmifilum sp.]|uniref:hydrolase n=1 Tax=Infirmifilum TaxID=2856573 RepID=UPI003C70628F